jgi:hypothetical protein
MLQCAAQHRHLTPQVHVGISGFDARAGKRVAGGGILGVKRTGDKECRYMYFIGGGMLSAMNGRGGMVWNEAGNEEEGRAA